MILEQYLTELLLGFAVFSGVLNFILIINMRWRVEKDLNELESEMTANHLACYGMARQLRAMQKGDWSAASDRKAATAETRKPDTVDDAADLMEAGADINRLVDELGVSRTEAEIITHLRPRRRNKTSVSV
ncbi:MAG: hypothetical protein KDI36_17900 [Pseudomonadales bacterium]|nr:hypothetical protein [Pseudomonadales bacterium]